MKTCWKTYELQIAERLSTASQSEWSTLQYRRIEQRESQSKLIGRLDEFANRQQKRPFSSTPTSSEVSMDRLYWHCSRQYDDLRKELTRPEVEEFDRLFSKWLYFVYDPIECLKNIW